MFKELTYQRKLSLLIAGSVVLFIIVYYLAINKTIIRKNLYSEAHQELVLIENAPVKMAEINAELDNIKKQVGGENSSTKEFREKLLDKTTVFCEKNKTNLVELPDPVITKKLDFNIVTHSLTLKGPFNELLNYIYDIEQKSRISKITSCRFYTKKNIRTKKNNLYLKVYLQNTEKNRE